VARVHRAVTSSRSPQDVWSVIQDFYGIDQWCPWVASSRRDETRPNVRIVEFQGGGQAAEELLELHPNGMRYRVLDETGVLRDYEGTLAVTDDPDGKGSRITWGATFGCDVAMEDTLTRSIAGSFEAGLAALR
jgi:hypothetical protein